MPSEQLLASDIGTMSCSCSPLIPTAAGASSTRAATSSGSKAICAWERSTATSSTASPPIGRVK